jgi:hypothetical protein
MEPPEAPPTTCMLPGGGEGASFEGGLMPEAAAPAIASTVRIGNKELAAVIDATRDARRPEARMVLRTACDLSLTAGIVRADGPLREGGRAHCALDGPV